MTRARSFVVQDSIHADWVSRHETRADAVAAIDEMIREGVAEPGEFNIREIDNAGDTVRVFGGRSGTAGLRSPDVRARRTR